MYVCIWQSCSYAAAHLFGLWQLACAVSCRLPLIKLSATARCRWPRRAPRQLGTCFKTQTSVVHILNLITAFCNTTAPNPSNQPTSQPAKQISQPICLDAANSSSSSFTTSPLACPFHGSFHLSQWLSTGEHHKFSFENSWQAIQIYPHTCNCMLV